MAFIVEEILVPRPKTKEKKKERESQGVSRDQQNFPEKEIHRTTEHFLFPPG